MAAPVDFIPNAIPTELADAYFAVLAEDLPWIRHDDAPRSEYYCNDTPVPYTYGRGAGERTYEVQPWHPAIVEIRKTAESIVAALMDVCFLNRYHGERDWLGWHADDSASMDPKRPIISVTLGAERAIQFRPIGGGDVETLMLTHGSMAVMRPGMQQAWEHRIPKVGHRVGERISLTFRGFVA